MRLVNLTPHPVNILAKKYHHGTGKWREHIVTLQPEPLPARVTERLDKTFEERHYEGVGLVSVATYRPQINDLPDPVEGVVYVVSARVAIAACWRDDLIAVHELRELPERVGPVALSLRLPK